MPEQHVDPSVYRRRRLVLAGGLVALVALGGVVVAQLDGDDEAGSPTGTASTEADEATTTPAEDTDPSVAVTDSVPATDASGETTTPGASGTAGTSSPDTSAPATSADGSDPTPAPTDPPPATDRVATTGAPTSAPGGDTTSVTSSAVETTTTTVPPTTIPPSTGPATTVVETTVPETTTPPTTVPPTIPDTPPNEITARWDGEGAVMTGAIASEEVATLARGVVEEFVLGAPIDDRTVVDPSIGDGIDPSLIIEDLRGVGFDRDVYDTVSEPLAETLTQLAAVLEQHPDASVVLIGHAITDGDDAADREAAIRRARTALAFLVEVGVDEERLATFGAGEDGTVPTSGETSINRRIDYIVDGLAD